MTKHPLRSLPEQAIAIVGMAGRFPGANNIEAFWQVILSGADSITRFPKQDDAPEGYVAARGVLADADRFDASFFAVTPVDAERMDPQHRVLLEVAEEALEHAGYCAARYPGDIGIFAGCSLNTYLLNNLLPDRAATEKLAENYQVGEFPTALGNDKDFLTTRIAYKLNLRGPSITVQAACATSLVAITQAAQSLLNGQCDMALAGGVSITFPQERGHIAQEGSLLSGDGSCRPFDAAASGTVFGHGAGMVLLKRLEDAVADGDTVHAVLRGFAVTNDGAEKVGYMAPGLNGQMRAIRAAQGMAGLDAADISYIEAHGTATPLGDPVEFAALDAIFGRASAPFCVIGSAKANVGHLDAAAGVTGVIKTVLSMRERTLPALAHFSTPNPHLSLQGSAFRFNTNAQPWQAPSGVMRAGVSAFGVGGVNAHVVLEEAPAFEVAAAGSGNVPLLLSARTPEALAATRTQLAEFLVAQPEANLRDVVYTLAVGRHVFSERYAVVAATTAEAARALESGAALEGGDAARAIAEQWLAGDDQGVSEFFASFDATRVPLPTYPFERTRFWVEPVASATSTADSAPGTPEADAPSAEAHQPQVRDRAAEELRKVSGVSIGPEEDEISFLELGFDSLCITQATQTLSKAFGVPVTFRQLMEGTDSLQKLVEYIESALPQEASAPAAKTPAKPVASPAAASVGEVKHGAFRTVQKVKHAVDPKQMAYLESLLTKYQARTPGSKSITAASRAHLADPRAVAGFRPLWKEMVYPVVTDRASGSTLIDVDGNTYIDLVNGYGCIMFGHSPEFVTRAAEQQMRTGVAIGPQSLLAGEVAETFAKHTGNERVTFCNTGSEAVMAAIRVARTVTGRDRIVYFTGDYHGTFDEVLVRSTPAGTLPIAPGIPYANVGNVMVLEYGSEATLAYLREHAEDLAAVLIEPVQTRHPEVQPIDFLREVRELTASAGTVMIMDEVVTGFRVAPGGFQEYAGIRADLCTYGKVLGGGYPLGVLSGKAKYMDALDGGAWNYGDASAPEVGMTFFAGTFVRHPLALSIARAVLQHLEEEGPGLQRALTAKAERMMASINEMFAERSIPYTVHGFSSWFYVSFPSEWALAPLFYYAMRARGVHIQEGYPCFMTTAHTDTELDTVLEAFAATLAEMDEAGIFPHAEKAAIKAAYEASLLAAASASPNSAPLTESQKEVFLAANLSDDANCAFNEALTLTLTGPVDEQRLRFALDAAIARHDALRSTVDETGEQLTVHPAFPEAIAFVDLTARPVAERDEIVREHIATDAVTPFDLLHGPLVRVACFLEDKERVTVFLSAHHIIFDGWSANELLGEIAAIYSGGSAGARALAAPMSFGAYARREAKRRANGEFLQNEAYWLSIFEGRAPQLNLPTDRLRPAVRGFSGATLRGSLPSTLIEAARAAGKKQGCSLYVVLLASFQMLLHRLTQDEEVVVGISTAGQALLAQQKLVGHCVNFLPIVSDLAKGESVTEFWKKTRKAMLDAQDHQEYTFGSLLKALPWFATPAACR